MNPLTIGSGWRTYLAAAGLLGYALYQASTGDYAAAWQSLMAALAAFGLRQAIAKSEAAANQATLAARSRP